MANQHKQETGTESFPIDWCEIQPLWVMSVALVSAWNYGLNHTDEILYNDGKFLFLGRVVESIPENQSFIIDDGTGRLQLQWEGANLRYPEWMRLCLFQEKRDLQPSKQLASQLP